MSDAIDIAPPGNAEEAAEEAYEAFVHKNLPRNFAAHYIHGMLGMTGFRLFNAPTFMPAYLHMLTGSDALVGLGQSLQQLGGVFSPVIGATHIEHRKRVLPISMLMGTLMRVQILGVALAGFFLHGSALVIVSMGFLFLLGVFSGAQTVAFQLLLAKVIPTARRGRLQALRNTTGGAIAAGLAWFAGRYFIQPNLFGNGYGVTFLAAFVLTSLGLTALTMLLKEPEPPTVRTQTPFFERVKDFPKLLRDDRGFMFFMIAQTLAVSGRIAAPFYILFTRHVMQLDGANLGLVSLRSISARTPLPTWSGAWSATSSVSAPPSSVRWRCGSPLRCCSSAPIRSPSCCWPFLGLGSAQSGFPDEHPDDGAGVWRSRGCGHAVGALQHRPRVDVGDWTFGGGGCLPPASATPRFSMFRSPSKPWRWSCC